MATRIALLQVGAKRGGTTQLDGPHHAPLDTGEPLGMGLPILRTTAAKDVRHFERRSHGWAQLRSEVHGDAFKREPVEA